MQMTYFKDFMHYKVWKNMEPVTTVADIVIDCADATDSSSPQRKISNVSRNSKISIQNSIHRIKQNQRNIIIFLIFLIVSGDLLSRLLKGSSTPTLDWNKRKIYYYCYVHHFSNIEIKHCFLQTNDQPCCCGLGVKYFISMYLGLLLRMNRQIISNCFLHATPAMISVPRAKYCRPINNHIQHLMTQHFWYL